MVCSVSSQRSPSPTSLHSRTDLSRSRSRSVRRSYTPSDHTRSRSRSIGNSFHSRRSIRSKSHSHYSRSRSRSSRHRSRSWSRSRSVSRSRSRHWSNYSHSRSNTPSRLRSSYRSGHRRAYFRSRSRSCSYESRRNSCSQSPLSEKSSEKDRKDRLKRIRWMNNIWIVGEKAKDTIFHFCDICDLPIVIYGRLLPCKHVLCYTCAINLPQKCNLCQKSIQTVERCLVGGIFMCFESDTCRRTYLSQRDLQAHIDHRHKGAKGSVSDAITTTDIVQHEINVSNVQPQFSTNDEQYGGHSASDTVIYPNGPSLLGSGLGPVVPNFLASQKDGLLPLPATKSASSNLLMPGRFPLGITCSTSSLGANNFQHSINKLPASPTSAILPTFIPPQSMQNQASAVAALAAVVSASMSKPGAIRPPPNANNLLQPNVLSASLIANALRMAAGSNWSAQPNNSNIPNPTGMRPLARSLLPDTPGGTDPRQLQF